MLMGVERAVTRWYARRQMMQNEVAVWRTRLAALDEGDQHSAEYVEAARQLAAAHTRLLDLGPCPRPTMG